MVYYGGGVEYTGMGNEGPNSRSGKATGPRWMTPVGPIQPGYPFVGIG